MHNPDYCDLTEELIFGTFSEFKLWIEKEKGENFKNIEGFITPPITIADESEGIFLNLFRVAYCYQSGEIHYCRR